MRKKKTVSIVLSIITGAVGILLIYVFFSAVRSVIDFVLGTCLLFLAIFNFFLTVKSSKNQNNSN
ncbi:MAG TPA: hypothetical protein VIL05_08315 [Thermoclostridium sp.]